MRNICIDIRVEDLDREIDGLIDSLFILLKVILQWGIYVNDDENGVKRLSKMAENKERKNRGMDWLIYR